MKRWVFNIAAGLSVVLGISVAVLWVRSYQYEEGLLLQWYEDVPRLGIHMERRCVQVHTERGGLWYGWEPDRGSELVNPGVVSVQREFFSRPLPLLNDQSGPVFLFPTHLVRIPFWFLSLAASGLPLLWFATRINRWQTRRLGLCLTCGYDLRATLDRCPECGAPVPAGHVATVTTDSGSGKTA